MPPISPREGQVTEPGTHLQENKAPADLTPYARRQRVLAALTDRDGNPKPWYAAEEIGYSSFCEGMTVRQIAAALSWFKQRGFVAHRGDEWKITNLGLELSRSGL